MPAIVIAVGDQPPAFIAAAFDIGLTGLPLSVEGLNSKSKICSVEFAGCRTGTADGFGPLVHAALGLTEPVLPCPSRRPKNLGPFQLVPVMSLAMADRLG